MQPIPPRGPAELQPKERLGSREAAWRQCWCARAGGLPLAPLPSPRALPLPWPSGGPAGAGFPPTLGFWRFQSLCVRWRFPLFSLIFKAFTTSSPFIHVSHHTRPLPQLPGQHSSCQRWTLRRTLPPLLRPSLHSVCCLMTRKSPFTPPHLSGGLWQCPIPIVAQLKWDDTLPNTVRPRCTPSDPQCGPRDKSV